ncbi:hypothetical protein KY308_00210 [Candidatus Woesearchaeota archaeon]|nr:hypothetical protein [Candidatus Woesearchaeota archaeon]
MNKKADFTANQIAVIILVLVCGVLLILWLQPWKEKTEMSIHKQKCKDAVETLALATVRQFTVPATVECPTLNIKIAGDPSIEKQAGIMKKEIADLMAETWDVFGRGELNLFSSSGVYCMPYGIIDFENKKGEIKDFAKYLATAQVPLSGKDYLAYLTNGELGNSETYLLSDTGKVINTSRDYAVVFIYARELGAINNWINFLGGGESQQGSQVAGTIGVGVLGAEVGALGVVLIGGGPVTITLGAVAAGVTATYAAVFGGEPPEWYAMVVLTPYDSEDSLKELGCQYFPIELGTR